MVDMLVRAIAFDDITGQVMIMGVAMRIDGKVF